MEEENNKVLIIGKGSVVSALARKFKQQGAKEIYATCPCYEEGLFQVVDISENDLTELLKFSLEKEIDLTIPVNDSAFNSDLVSFFSSNNQNIFGPSKQIYNTISNRISEKKLLYKIHAQTPKFGIFNKIQNAKEFLEKSFFPVIIQSPQISKTYDNRLICNTESDALKFFEKLTTSGENEIIIEEFVYAKPITLYFISDGYSILPIISVYNYNFSRGEYNGVYTDGIGCYCPDFSITSSLTEKIQNIAQRIISNFEEKGTPYVGILGLDCLIKKDNTFLVNGIRPFLQNHDARAVLNACEDNLYNIFKSCVNNFFSDEYSQIKTNNLASVSTTICAPKNNIQTNELIQLDENIDFINVKSFNDGIYEFNQGECFTLTETKATLTTARNCLKEDIELLNKKFEYRKDISQKEIL